MMASNGAALILAFGYPPGVGALSRYFAAAGLDLFVHVDRKVSCEPFRAGIEGDERSLLLERRTNVFWRGFSMVEATVDLITVARERCDYKYFLLLSDDSLPLIPARRLAAALESGGEFLECAPTSRPEFLRRYNGYYMFDSEATQVRWLPVDQREVTPDAIARMKRLEALRARGKKPLSSLFHGSQWWALRKSSIDLILESWRHDGWLRESFEFSEVPDEHYFHTVIGLAERQPKWATFVHTEWDVQTPPRIYRTLDEVIPRAQSGAPFIRKARLEPRELDSYMAALSLRN